jgi:branched-chain amino acid transport system substrate-binding protein
VIGLPSEENKKFKDGLKAKFPNAVPNFVTAESYDAMQLAYHMIESQKGKKFDGASAVASALGYTWNGARGPLKIEPDTHDTTLNVYIRRVEKVNGKLENVLVDTYPMLKDPWVAQKKGK